MGYKRLKAPPNLVSTLSDNKLQPPTVGETMGKHGKKQSHQQQQRGRRRRAFSYDLEEGCEEEKYPPSNSEEANVSDEEGSDNEVEEEDDEGEEDSGAKNNLSNNNLPSKFWLYQQSVQCPKGDISYLQKFFLMYVGGRAPIHLQEDFCGTAFLSTEWLRADARRTAVGLDLDEEALLWCMDNNVNKIGADVYSRIFLFHGNVLEPLEAKLVNFNPQEVEQRITLDYKVDGSKTSLESSSQRCFGGVSSHKLMKETQLPARDIVCAFNYSCCCLHTRNELISYFKHTHNILNKKGAIFVMDLYGGTSAERELILERRFPNFRYIWEQAGFDIIQRKTRISLHFNLKKPSRKLHNVFSYSWRLWSLPEIKDCLEEAGFRSVHFWIRSMPDSEEIKSVKGFGAGQDTKYEQVSSFQQQDSWNAYVVADV